MDRKEIKLVFPYSTDEEMDVIRQTCIACNVSIEELKALVDNLYFPDDITISA